MTEHDKHQLVIGTSNPGKVRELRALLPPDLLLLSLEDLGLPSPEETGSTLQENAQLKAVNAAMASGMLALADDSGLEVEALGGAPGIRSARYAGAPPDEARNRQVLLEALADVPAAKRVARFVCAVAVASPRGQVWTSEGSLAGTILDRERGSGGFGYDSLFLLGNGRTVAELLDEEKNELSHRSVAIKAILPKLQEAILAHDADRHFPR